MGASAGAVRQDVVPAEPTGAVPKGAVPDESAGALPEGGEAAGAWPEGDAPDAPVRTTVCGVALSTPQNLTAVRAGAALDQRVAPLAAYEDGYAPAK